VVLSWNSNKRQTDKNFVKSFRNKTLCLKHISQKREREVEPTAFWSVKGHPEDETFLKEGRKKDEKN